MVAEVAIGAFTTPIKTRFGLLFPGLTGSDV